MVDKSTLKTIGLVTILIALVLSIGAIVISGIDFEVLNVKWNNSPWRHLGILQLVSTIFAAVVSLIGLFIFILFFEKRQLIGFVNFYFFIIFL